jgi:hypothetical protein
MEVTGRVARAQLAASTQSAYGLFAFAPNAAGVMELWWRGYRFVRSR